MWKDSKIGLRYLHHTSESLSGVINLVVQMDIGRASVSDAIVMNRWGGPPEED